MFSNGLEKRRLAGNLAPVLAGSRQLHGRQDDLILRGVVNLEKRKRANQVRDLKRLRGPISRVEVSGPLTNGP